MGSLWRTFRGWFRGLDLPPPDRDEVGESGGVADRELDGPAWSLHEPAAVPSVTPTARPSGTPADYRGWEELALLLFSGRAPEGLEVEHSLSLAKLRVRSLPARMSVRGDLDLRQCQRLKTIGDGLRVSGDLIIGGRCPETPWWEMDPAGDARGEADPASVLRVLSRDDQCPLPGLPSGLRVGRDLRLRRCRRLERLPDDLRVGRSVHLEGCTSLASLPEPFVVHGDLTVSAAPSLTSLPAGLRVGGSLRLVGVRVERLPEGLRVGGDLILECCPRLASLPDRLDVGGSLVVRRCPIDRLPSCLRVGRDVRLHRLPDLTRLPESLSVPGRLELNRCPSLRGIAPGLRVGADLIIRRCEGVRDLPEGLHIPGTLDLRGCTHLEALPKGLDVGSDLGDEVRTRPAAGRLHGPDVAPRGLDGGRADRRRRIGAPGTTRAALPLGPYLVEGRRRPARGDLPAGDADARADPRPAERRASPGDAGAGRPRPGAPEGQGRGRGQRSGRRGRSPPRSHRAAGRFGRDRDRCYLHCRCPSTGRDYLLRVPPETRTCRQAAAWLAGFDDPEAYRPVLET